MYKKGFGYIIFLLEFARYLWQNIANKYMMKGQAILSSAHVQYIFT